MSAKQPSSGATRPPPGPGWLSRPSSRSLGPAASRAPRPTPIAAAGTATSSASSAATRVTWPREAPIARQMPIACSRRWISARAAAVSIVAAVSSAISESAPSSAITIPAAWSIRTRTPLRVISERPVSP